MPSCCVVGCQNRTKDGVKLFGLPAGSHPFQRNRRRLWLQAIKRVWDESSVKKDVRVCSAHFISGKVKLSS